MSRVVQFLTGITVASAASAVLNCDAPMIPTAGRSCSSCVGTGVAQACVNYTVPPPPSCAATCGAAAPLGSPVANCSVMTAGASASTACVICAPVLNGVGGVGVCITTNFGIAPYLAAQSTFDAELDLDAFVKGQVATTITNIDATTAAANASISGNAVVVLNAAASAAAIAAVSADASANAIFQVNASTHVNSWNSGASAKVNNNNGGALVVDQLSVDGRMGAGNKFSVWQNAGASVSLNNINFAFAINPGIVQIVGGAAHIGASGSASANVTGSGILQLGGGVSVDGNVPQTMTIDVSGSGSSNAPVATIDASSTLSTSGDVTADTENGVISVNGNFMLGSTSTTVEPKVILNAGASFVVNSSTQLHAKAVDIYAGATFVISASANRTGILINKISKCLGTVQIKLATTAAVFIAANNATASVGFYYDSTNNVQDLKNCAVEVWDSAGTKFTLTSTTSASAGRRLLASDGTAQWNSDSMTFQMDNSNKTTTSTNSASVSFAVIPVLMVSLAGLLF